MRQEHQTLLLQLASRYQKLIDYFIPARLAADRDAKNRARMFLISHTVGPILGNSVPLALSIFDPTPGPPVAILALSITAFWIFPFLLKRGWSYDVLVLASVVNLNFAILWSCFFYGGVASPTLPWVLIIPILSLFYIGGERRLQSSLLLITAGSFAIFLAAYYLIRPAPDHIPANALQWLGIVSTTATLSYVATMAFYYARIFDAGVALENDVRRRRQAADELRFAVAAADRAGAAKTEFLAKMSHELRAPLNSVIGYSQLLAENAIKRGDTAMTKDVNRIYEAGQYLLDLINTILDMAKIDSGRIQFNPKQVGVRDTIDEAVRHLKPVIEQNGNRVSVQVDEGIGLVLIDRLRFIQILDSIITNAAQYTRDGFIAIHAQCVPGSAGSRAFSVSISDSGTGIDPERLSTLFETFTASQEASGGRYGGTGLSLSVTYKLCQAMGGDIFAESCPGKGSTFIVTLPLDGTAPRAVGAAMAAGRKDA